MVTPGILPTPEELHLAEQRQLLAELTERLAEQETSFAEDGARFAAFRGQYIARFAPLYAELDALESNIAQLLAERDGSREARERAEEAANRASESEAAANAAVDPAPAQSPPTEEVRAAYRHLAKLIHPDLAPSDEERSRRTKLMAEANDAYRAGDVARLNRMITAEAARPEAVAGDGVAAELIKVLRQISQVRARFQELVELRHALEADPVWRVYVRVSAHQGPDILDRAEADLRQQIASAKARLAALVAPKAQ